MTDTQTSAGHAGGANGLPLTDDYEGARDLSMHYVASADGTKIAYEVSGSGPAVVIVGGGLNDRAMFTPLASIMDERFTVYNYDRRGRGDSDIGDLDAWSIEREVEDLRAVIDAVDGPVHVFANCTGGMVAIHAAASGVPMERLALYEPPYWSPEVTEEQLANLRRLVAEDKREEVVTIFARDIVGFLTDESIADFKSHPAWAAFMTMVPSAYYDAIISKDHSQVPHELLQRVGVPVLVMRGDIGEQEIHDSCAVIAEEIEDARLVTVGGCDHLIDQQLWARFLMGWLES